MQNNHLLNRLGVSGGEKKRHTSTVECVRKNAKKSEVKRKKKGGGNTARASPLVLPRLGVAHARHVDEVKRVLRVVVHHEVIELLGLSGPLGGKRQRLVGIAARSGG